LHRHRCLPVLVTVASRVVGAFGDGLVDLLPICGYTDARGALEAGARDAGHVPVRARRIAEERPHTIGSGVDLDLFAKCLHGFFLSFLRGRFSDLDLRASSTPSRYSR